MRFHRCKSILLLFFILLENFLFSGVIYGWEDLLKLLRKAKLFSRQCFQDENGSKCFVQENMFNLLYTICFLAKALSGIFTLHLLRKLSLGYVRVVPLFFLFSGGMMMAFAIDGNSKIMYSGAVLISIAGGQILFCSFSVVDLFPNNRCTVISLCCGSFCASHAIFYIFNVFQEDMGATIRQMFMVWSASSLIMLLPNFFLLKELHQPVKHMYAANVAGMFTKMTMTTKHNKKKYHLVEGDGSSDESETDKKKTRSLEPALIDEEDRFEGWRATNIMESIPFFLHVWWVSVVLLVLSNYRKITDAWSSVPDTDAAGGMVLLLRYGPFMMFLISPVIGILLDLSVNRLKEETHLENLKKKRLRSGAWSIVFSTLMVYAVLALRMIDYITIWSEMLYIVAYATTTTVATAYISVRFPWDVFRNLLSILWLVTSTFGLLQFPLETLQSIYPLWPSIISMLLMTSALVSVAHPFVPALLKNINSVSVIS